MRPVLGGATLLLALLAAGPVRAAGGAHVIDDAAVETPGSCHLENWATLSSGESGLVNSAAACTRKAWPNLELGGFVAHDWAPESSDTVVGLSPKLVLRPEDRGMGIGVAASVGYGLRRRRFETASLVIPVTIPAGKVLRFNLNAGWHWTRVDEGHAMFAGAQAEIAVRQNLSLMVEAFARNKGEAGGQAGLRWTVARGRIDLDLIGGRYVDGATRNAITFGATFRG